MRSALQANAPASWLKLAALPPALLVAVFALAAHGQSAAIRHVRGVLQSVTADALKVQTNSGGTVDVAITDKTPVVLVSPVEFSAIKPGSYIGTAAVPGAGGQLRALEVHVFADKMRGVGEGHGPWPGEPESTMTNGTVGEVTGTGGRTLHVTYKGGEQTVVVPDNAPIVTMEPAGHAVLASGAHVMVSATAAADHEAQARFVVVGKDGYEPPL